MAQFVINFSRSVALVFFIVFVDCDDVNIKPPSSVVPNERSILEVLKSPDAHVKNDSLKSTSLDTLMNLSKQTSFHYDSKLNSSFDDASFSKPFVGDQEIHKTTKPNTVNNNFSTFALEGGGTAFLTPNSSNTSFQDHLEVSGDEFHSKGSKGRKGVKFPGSSVVPRKGVPSTIDQLGEIQLYNNTYSNSTTLSRPIDHLVASGKGNPIDSKAPLNETTKQQVNIQTHETPIKPNVTHKKPEYVSDEKDVDDFNSYSIIKISTTGEDYVIISIVVVIGIWFSVFGALIFYRRAGEYWDRRHYRRMDFLVEGMYNE